MADNREVLAVELRAENELAPGMAAAIQQLDKFGVTAEESAAMLDRALGRAQAKYGSFAVAAGQAAEQVEGSWKTSLKSINQLVDQIATTGNASGNIDLGVKQAQEAVAASRQRLVILEQLEAAEIRNAGAENIANAAVQAHIGAIRTAIAEEQARAKGLALEAGALERLQIELRNSTGAEQLFSNSVRQAGASSGATRAGMQNLGFQLQDIAVQFASGQRAGTIFAQQLPQVSMAVTQIAQATGATTGVLGRFLGLMSGPWGIAIGVGTAVLTPFIAKLFETGEAAKAAAAEVNNFGAMLDKARTKPMEALGDAQKNYYDQIAKLNRIKAGLDEKVGPVPGTRSIDALLRFNRAVADQEVEVQGAKEKWDALGGTIKTNASLFENYVKAGKFKARAIDGGDDGAGGAGKGSRRTGSAGRDGLRDTSITVEQLRKEFDKANVSAEEFGKKMDALFAFQKSGAIDPEAAFRMRVNAATGNEARKTIFDAPDDLADRVKTAYDTMQAELDKLGKQKDPRDFTPFEAYRAHLEAVTGDMNGALEQVKVNGLQSLEDGLAGVITGTQSVADAFKNMANAIIADLVRIAVKKLILSVLGFSDGGLIKAEGKATGGLISGPGSGTSDDVPIWASNGEFMMRAEAVRRIGVPTLEALNSGRMPGFATGGLIGSTPRAPRMPSMRGLGGSRGQVVHQHVWQVNARGAVLAEGLIAEMQAVGVRAAVGGAELSRVQSGERQMSTLY